MDVRVRVLGGFEVSSATEDIVPIPTRKARALLAVLARRSDEPQSRDALAALLWPDNSETQARGGLRQALKLLRRSLRDVEHSAIMSEGDTLTLRTKAAEIDVASFELLCRQGTADSLERAVDLYRGDFLAGFAPPTEPFAEWVAYERTGLRERAISALSTLVTLHTGEARRGPAVRIAVRLLALDPLQEHVHRLLMRLYLEQGRRGAAVEQYRQCRAILQRELGVGPEPETDQLYREIQGPRSRIEPAPPSRETAAATDPLLSRPAVAVLPFRNMSEDPAQEYFSDGLTEDIITALTLWRSFPVIARNSTFTYKDKPVDIKQAGRELGARYLIEGSVRKGGQRVRITAQLIDGVGGHHIWAEKYDRELDDIFEVQDEIAQRIAAIVAPELARAEVRRSTAKRPEDLDAWDYCLRGMAMVRERTCEGNAKARELFGRAIAIQPDYADAHAGLAMSCNFDILLHCAEDRMATATLAMEAARRAVKCDETSSIAHQELSTAYQWLNRHDDALAEVRIAVDLNPNDAIGLHQLGNKSDLAGDPEGISYMEKAQKLNPVDVQMHTRLSFLARAYVNVGSYEDAVDRARKAIQRRPDYPHAHYILAVALGHLGRSDEARAALSTSDALHPGFIDSRRNWQPYVDPRSNETLRDGLRRLGMESVEE